MSKFEQDYFNLLINESGFYVEELKGKDNKELWIAIKTVNNDGKYAVIISKSSDEEENFIIAEEYLKSLNKEYSLHNIVLYKEYNPEEENEEDFHVDKNYHRIIVDTKNKRIAKNDDASYPLVKRLLFILNKQEEPKLPWYKKLKCGKVTAVLIGINILAFIATLIVATILTGRFLDNLIEIHPEVLYLMGAKHNSAILLRGQYYRLVTSMFLHGGIIYLLFNMYALYILGDFTEKIYGVKKYLLIYFLSGITASLFSLYLSPVMSVGASGAIFGLLGSALVFAYYEKERIGKALITNIIVIILLNIVIGLSLPNIDISAHLGGFLAGVVLGIFFRKYKIVKNA